MNRRTSLLAAVVAVVGMASFAAAADNTQVVYAGGHNTTTLIRTQPVTQAPYALTGNQQNMNQKTMHAENIWVGGRFAGARVVEK